MPETAPGEKQVAICWPWELPDRLSAVAVTDVFAATSNIAWFLNQNVNNLIVVNQNNIHTAMSSYPEALIIGDDPNIGIQFHRSNCPSDIATIDVTGKTILYLTKNGSRIIEQAINKGADPVLAASFTNIQAVADYLNTLPKTHITLIPAGERTSPHIPDHKAQEDLLCARSLQHLLLGQDINWDEITNTIQQYLITHYDYPKKFSPDMKQKDIQTVTQLNTHPIIPRCIQAADGFIHIFAVSL